jgi:hypothetical protein
MKRLLALLLAATLLLGAIACGDDSGKAGQTEAEASEAPTAVPTAVPTPTEVPTPTPEPTPEPTKSPADLWAELSDRYPALYATGSSRRLRLTVLDPSAYGIDADALLPIAFGSEEECRRYYQDLHALLDLVNETDRSALNEADQFAFDTVVESLQAELALENDLAFDEPFLPNSGTHISLPSVFVNFRIKSKEDAEAYLREISYIPTYIDKLIEREQAHAESGHFMTEDALDSVLSEIDMVKKPGKDFFGYAYLGSCLTAIGMSEEEQAPYLTRSDAAIDAFLASYDKLYAALDGLRQYCEDPLTPYVKDADVKNSDRYRNYNAQLMSIVGTETPILCDKVGLIYDTGIQYLEREFSEIRFPEDFAAQMDAFRNKLPETYYREIVASLEKEYAPLDFIPAIGNLPALDIPYLGSAKFTYYFDHPEQSTIVFNPDVDNSSVVAIYLACSNYFYLYQAQKPDLSRAQLSAAPDSYFSGLGLYTALAHTKEEAERTGNYCEYYTLFMILYNYMMIGYTANLIEMGYAPEDIKKDLTEFFRLPEDMADTIYKEARSNPLSAIEFTYGCAEMIVLREACRNKLRGRMNERQFLKQYLSCGPAFFDQLEKKMDAWCDTMLGAGNA